MMWWDGDGSWSHHGWWWVGAAMMIVVMVACMIVMARMMGHGMHGSHAGNPIEEPRSDSPERILANRLAQGEIDTEEYERRLAALRCSGEAGGTSRRETV